MMPDMFYIVSINIYIYIWDLVEMSSSKKWLKVVFTWGPATYSLLLAHTHTGQ